MLTRALTCGYVSVLFISGLLHRSVVSSGTADLKVGGVMAVIKLIFLVTHTMQHTKIHFLNCFKSFKFILTVVLQHTLLVISSIMITDVSYLLIYWYQHL